MRLYSNCCEAIKDIARELKKCSTEIMGQTMQNKQISNNEDFKTREIQGFSFSIIDTTDKDEMPNVTLEWCKAEFLERIDLPANPGQAWKLRKEVWEEFLVGGLFEYTYSQRMYWQLKPVIAELKKNPETRQAIIQIHDRNIDQHCMGRERVPCSMFYHFMFRNEKLDIIYNMRSSDFATHFCNDIHLAIQMQEYIAKKINVTPGKFIMQVSSLHIYKKDFDLLQRY